MDFYEQVALTFIGEIIKTALGQITRRLFRGPEEVRTLTRYDAPRENPELTGQFASIIRELQQQARAIDRALNALREIDGTTVPATASIEKPASTRKGKKRSAATRQRMRDAQRARWAAKRAEADRVPF